MASDAATTLADDFAAANGEAIAFAHGCDDADWSVSVPGEGWSVGVVLHHIAEGHVHAVHWLQVMMSGEGVTETAADIDRGNAQHAVRAEAIGRVETVALLQENGQRLDAVLRGLTDEQLATEAPFGPAGGRVFPLNDLAPVTVRHTREHLAHARNALNREG